MSVGSAVLLTCTLLLVGNASVSARHTSKGSSLPVFRWNGLVRAVPWTKTLDPAVVTDLIDFNIMSLVDANIVKLTPNAGVEGDLAKRWTVSGNHKVYTFFFRKGLRFENGDPITAQDAAWSITRALAKKTASPVATLYFADIVGAVKFNAGKAKSVAGLKVINSTTLRITLDRPIQEFLDELTYPTSMVLDPKVVGGHPAKTYLTNTCSANNAAGPFKFVCQNKSSDPTSFYPSGSTPTMTLVPNTNYYGSKPHIKIVIPTIASDQTAYDDYLSGHLDESNVPSSNVAQWRGKEIKTVLAGVEYITPNEDTAPFDNVHCRLAVAYAIDRNALFNKVLHGTGIPVYDVVPIGFLGYYAGNDNPHYNPTKAKQELAACPGGIHNVELDYQHTTTDYDLEYSAIQSMLNSVGIGIKLKPLTHNDWLGIVGATSLQSTHTAITQNDYYEDYPDPQDYCTLLLHSGSAYDIGDFKNKTYDKLVDRAEVTANKATRAALYRQAQHIALADGAWISLQNFVQFTLVKPYVHGLVPSTAYSTLWAKNDDWSKVTISKH